LGRKNISQRPVVGLAAIACLGPISVWAQLTPSQKIFGERFNSLLGSYRDCVSAASVNDFWKKKQFEMAVEQAFTACRTEEDALRLLMRSAAPQISTNPDEIILGEKADMKRRLVPR
jgi:hypothetical protein